MVFYLLLGTLHFHALCLHYIACEVGFPHQDLQVMRGGVFFSFSFFIFFFFFLYSWEMIPTALTCNSQSWKIGYMQSLDWLKCKVVQRKYHRHILHVHLQWLNVHDKQLEAFLV